MNNSYIYIYGLVDPRNKDEVRYVGWTVNPLRRLKDHLGTARKDGSAYRDRWIRTLLKIDMVPHIVILEEGWLNYNQAEPYWIHLARTLGHRLTNMTPGGDGSGPGPRPPETQARIRAANSQPRRRAQEKARMLEKWQDKDWREFVIARNKEAPNGGRFPKGHTPANKGKPGPPAWNKGKKGIDDSTRAKISAAKKGKAPPNKGKRTPDGIRDKISAATKLAMSRPEVRERYLEGLAKRDLAGEKHPMYGKSHTQETKDKISAAKKGKQTGADGPFYGKKHSLENLKKMSAANKNRPLLTCPHCGKTMQGNGNLKQHIRAKHKDQES